MKHPVTQEMKEQLGDDLGSLGVVLDSRSQGRILEYLVTLLEANTRVNLTRITSIDDAIRLHLVDSLSALPEVMNAPAGNALDLGSGGGFPGVPLSFAANRHVVVLDSVAKKGAAVEAVLASLEGGRPDVDVASGRAEEYAVQHASLFAVVVARAVAPLPSLLELAAPLLVPGGVLVALKGCPESSERESAAAVGRIVGMEETGWREFVLPAGGEARTIASYTKVGRSSVRLPRRTGLAQHSPLA